MLLSSSQQTCPQAPPDSLGPQGITSMLGCGLPPTFLPLLLLGTCSFCKVQTLLKGHWEPRWGQRWAGSRVALGPTLTLVITRSFLMYEASVCRSSQASCWWHCREVWLLWGGQGAQEPQGGQDQGAGGVVLQRNLFFFPI